MEYPHHTALSQKNEQLNQYERGQIKLLSDEGLSPYAIGQRLGRVSNTIKEELGRCPYPRSRQEDHLRIFTRCRADGL
jgi:IS30 family transposase